MSEPETFSSENAAPFGMRELLAAVAGAARVLDAGCGSGRLTIALAQAGADVTGFDTSDERLEQAGRRARDSGVTLTLLKADLNGALPFPDASFDAVTSRLVLMASADATGTLRELARTLVAGGRVATVVWASLPENPWFAAPREAAAIVAGVERASFAQGFGKLGTDDQAATAHRQAGFRDVSSQLLVGQLARKDAAEHWHLLCRENGHFRRFDGTLDHSERAAVIGELEQRLAPYRNDNHLLLPRTMVLVTARR